MVAGYVIAWVVAKARRVAGRLDREADSVLDAGLDKLHAAVAGKLGAPVLADLDEEARTEGGEVSELTRQQVELAVTAAARRDEAFGQTVTLLLTQIRDAEGAAGAVVVAGDAAVFTGEVHADADYGGIAFGQVGGDVHLDRGGRPDPS